ncbi:MAG: DUF2142 domain-containing protein, partial [Thermoanaerobaculia bacterium]
AIAIVIALIAANAALWVIVVPIFESADEDLHFDYVMSIYSAGRLIRTAERPVAEITRVSPVAPNTHPVTHHLAVRSELDRIRFHPEEKVPAGYGSREFFQRINATMPPDDPQVRNPWLITEYPFGYYALVATWLRLVSFWRADPVTLFFAARCLSVVLLVISLSFAWAYLRRTGTDAARSLALIVIAGLFPYTAFIASYVQPDNLSFALVVITCYASLVAREAIRRGRPYAALFLAGLSLACLLVTKYHFFLCVAIAVFPMLLVEIMLRPSFERRWIRAAALLIVPSLIAGAMQLAVHQGARATWFQRVTQARRTAVIQSLGYPRYIGTRLAGAIQNYFLGGPSFRGFWGIFGWYDTPLIREDAPWSPHIRWMLLAGSATVLLLILVRCIQTIAKLARISRRRMLIAARTALSNPLANSYFAFVLFMLFVYVWLDNFFHVQARNWFPYTVIIFWLAVQYAPRALPAGRARRLFSLAILVVLAVYSIAGALYAIPVLRARYY